MEKERIEIIYKIIINGLVLNEHTLINYGFTEKEIDILINKRIIEHDKNGIYKLVSVDKLRQYGVKLLLTGAIRSANECFKICYKLAPNSKNICLQVLLAAVVRNDYNAAFEIFSNLEKIHPEKNIKDNNLYLYLLSIVTDCKEEYSKKVCEFEAEDLMLPNICGNKVENGIRKAIVQNKFTYAYQQMNSTIKREAGYSAKFELIRVLLIKAIEADKSFKKNILNLAKTQQYEEIISILRDRQQKRQLNKLETYIILITNAIINISKTKVIPPKTIMITYDIYEALLGNNFELALEINEEFLEYTKSSKEEDTVNILLVKLNKLISELKNISIQEKPQLETNAKPISHEIEETKKIKDAEEIANYIRSQNITIESAINKMWITHEQILLIKLVYARDYYIEANYHMGDKLLNEVEQNQNKTSIVLTLLNQIKSNRNNYQKQYNSHTRRLTQL